MLVVLAHVKPCRSFTFILSPMLTSPCVARCGLCAWQAVAVAHRLSLQLVMLFVSAPGCKAQAYMLWRSCVQPTTCSLWACNTLLLSALRPIRSVVHMDEGTSQCRLRRSRSGRVSTMHDSSEVLSASQLQHADHSQHAPSHSTGPQSMQRQHMVFGVLARRCCTLWFPCTGVGCRGGALLLFWQLAWRHLSGTKAAARYSVRCLPVS